MSNNAVSTPTVSSSAERFIGRVKWFNNRAGYGFITVTDGPKAGNDVFVHHSSIKVDSEQYKYLVQGEYVNFSLSDTKTSGHEFQAGEVCGINEGKLMCETRRESRVSRFQYRASKQENNVTAEPVKMPRSVTTPKKQHNVQHSEQPKRTRGQGPREENEWTYVAKAKKNAVPIQHTPQTPIKRRGRPSKTNQGTEKTQTS